MKRYIEVSKHVSGRTITQRYPARTVGTPLLGMPGAVLLAGHGGPVVFDSMCCEGCGYAMCSCPPAPVAPEPPADVLPEGWAPSDEEDYRHVSGAYVWQGKSSGYWYAERTGVPNDQTFYTRDEAMTAALASVKPEPPAPFKVGDRVMILVGDGLPLGAGCIGHITREQNGRLAVTDAQGAWWWFYASQLELAPALASVQPEPTLRAGWVKLSESHDVYRRIWTRQVFRLGDEWRVMGDSTHPTLEAAMLRAEELAGES